MSKDLYTELKDNRNLSIDNTNIGTFLSKEGNFEEAEGLFYHSLSYYQKNKDTISIIYSKINLASMMRDAGNYKRSNEILSTLDGYTKFNKKDEALVLYNFALNAKDTSSFTEASKFNDQAIALSEEINDEIQLIDLFYLKAEIAQNLKNYKDAIMYFNKSLEATIAIEDLTFEEELLRKIMEVKIQSKSFEQIDTLFQRIEVVGDYLTNLELNKSFPTSLNGVFQYNVA